MGGGTADFSFRTREDAIRRFKEETFDLLIVGGGITGAATARDAAMRGLKVALVDKQDFAAGTSSRSSKLIHGGLRYLENLEFKLVFEALKERTLLLRTVPNMVRPLPFYFPVHEGDHPGKMILGTGMWLYDVLSMFRAPGFHKTLSKTEMLKEFPFLKAEGLKGGFRYFDASMWDDVLTVEVLRSAQQAGAVLANYVEAVAPHWAGERISGYRLRDLEKPQGDGEIDIRAHQTVVCVGPWTDLIGPSLSRKWKKWLAPSRGVHLVFDLKRIPVPGAMVMNNPEDKRISFVIPRPDFGTGVVVVGTTDGPVPERPEDVQVENSDVSYLLRLLHKYFPSLKISVEDIISAYVGVRPLVGPHPGAGEEDSKSGRKSAPLQKVSREHYIDEGPGGTVVVAGGKYTTHRTMGAEVVDYALKVRNKQAADGVSEPLQKHLVRARTDQPINPKSTFEAIRHCEREAKERRVILPRELVSRYGADSLAVLEIDMESGAEPKSGDPEGFPYLSSQLRYAMRREMVVHLDDFYIRRTPIYLSRSDHGLPWAEKLSRVWAEERGLGPAEARIELQRLKSEINDRTAWKSRF